MTSGEGLIAFLSGDMAMSANYQPVLIRELIRAGGTASRQDLAQALLVANSLAVSRADEVLMRWPRRTLAKRGIATFDSADQVFRLTVEFDSEAQREHAQALCEVRIREWNQPAVVRRAARRFAAIRREQGRCQACGIPATVLPLGEVLDVDHIVPFARRNKSNKVCLDGTSEWIDVNDPRNLQVLCPACNRGKRDTDNFDFRASPGRLAEAIHAIHDLARRTGCQADLASALAEGASPQVALGR
ncbi:MAG: hypothetical protein JWO62_1176 [Acidimicrobiaceae bacterium]|nr:hypothetical protein [Acidimicrobiaceae bacterium]